MKPAQARQPAAWNGRRQEMGLPAGHLLLGLQQALARPSPAVLGCLTVELAGLGTVWPVQCQAGCHSKRSLVGRSLQQQTLAVEMLQAVMGPSVGAQRWQGCLWKDLYKQIATMMRVVLKVRLRELHLLLVALQPLLLPGQMHLPQQPVRWLQAMLRWGHQEQPLSQSFSTHARRTTSGEQQRTLLGWTSRQAQPCLRARAVWAHCSLPAPLQGLHRLLEVAACQASVGCRPLMALLGAWPGFERAWPSTTCQQHSAASQSVQVRDCQAVCCPGLP